MGEAYAGPALLTLRRDIPRQSPVVATVKHGDRLEIIQHHRRFMRVRTAKGVEGWADDYSLLSSKEIAALREVEQRALTLPSQGVASTYEQINVHTEPNRWAPSFLQIKTGEKVNVVAHLSTPRIPPDRPPLVSPKPKTQALHKRTDQKYPLPPLPAPPSVPSNWKQLSQTPPEVQQEIDESRAGNAPPLDDWSLVRNAGGESGWVLTRALYMAIPDEVAQYAEGRRITSYFPLSEVDDNGTKKKQWLWTTISSGIHPYDFDSFRVFIWSLRHHRYETAYIQRNVEGYFPVMANPGEFAVCLVNAAGQRVRRTYNFQVNMVHPSGEQPCEKTGFALPDIEVAGNASNAASPSAQPNRSLYARLKALVGRWFSR